MRKVFVVLLIAGTLFAQFGAPPPAGPGSWDKVSGPSGAWVYLVMAPYDGIAPKLNAAAARLGPDVVSFTQSLPQKIKNGIATTQGISADAVDMSRPIAVVVYNPLGGQAPVTILPVKPGVPVPPNKTIVNGYVVCSDNLTMATNLSQTLQKAGPSPIPVPTGIAHLYVDMGMIFQIVGPLAQMQLGMALSQQSGMSRQEQQLAGASVQLILDLVGQIKDFDLDIDVTADNVLATSHVNMKQDSELSKLFSSQKGGTALGHLLPQRSFSANAKLEGLSTWMFGQVDTFLAKIIANPQDLTSIREQLSKLRAGLVSRQLAQNKFCYSAKSSNSKVGV